MSHTTNIKVRELVVQHIGCHDSLLTVAKKRKLRWFGHVTRAKGRNPSKHHLAGHSGRQPKTWAT
jgi:hypothetical protein